MFNILPKKRDILPNKKIDAEKIIRNMIKKNEFQEADIMLRNKILAKQKLNNLVYQRDRIRGYIETHITPSLKIKLEKQIKGYDDEINTELFNLHVLGKKAII